MTTTIQPSALSRFHRRISLQHLVSNGRVLSFPNTLAARKGTDAYLAGVARRLSLEAHLPASQFSYAQSSLAPRLSAPKKRMPATRLGSGRDAIRGDVSATSAMPERRDGRERPAILVRRLIGKPPVGAGIQQTWKWWLESIRTVRSGSICQPARASSLGADRPRTTSVSHEATNPIAAPNDPVVGWPMASTTVRGRGGCHQPAWD